MKYGKPAAIILFIAAAVALASTLDTTQSTTLDAAAAAATAKGGTISDAQRTAAYTGGPFTAPNVTATSGSLTCVPDVAPCDDYALTVTLPVDYLQTHPGASIKVAIAPADATSDYDLYVLDAAGTTIADAETSSGSEAVSFPAVGGTNTYTIRAVPYSQLASAYDAQVTLDAELATTTQDADGDGVVDAYDECPGTPIGSVPNGYGCSGTEVSMPSDPDRPRVVVADIDSAINPYHAFHYQRPSSVTLEVLAELGVKPQHVVKLTRTGNFAADIAADAAFWNNVKRGERYHFAGTNIIATSLAAEGAVPYLKPTAEKNAHGVGTSAAVLNANPDAIVFFVEGVLGSAESHAAAFQNPAVDIVTTSYGASQALGLLPMPEYRAFYHSYEGVVGRGKLHFSSAGNGPGVSALRAGAGPWWSIGVSGIEEGSSEGDTLLSGNLPDFVSDFEQALPYCTTCENEIDDAVAGTSFSTPRSAGLASALLLDVRRTLKHKGGIRWVGDTPMAATNVPKSKRQAASCGTKRECVSVTNWQLRRALEQAAWTPDSAAYDPTQAPWGGVGLPIPPVAPWLTTAWGDLTTDPEKGVLSAALAELSKLANHPFGGTARVKPAGYCTFQTNIVTMRKAWFDVVAPTLPDNPVLTGDTPPPPLAQDPFVYCDTL